MSAICHVILFWILVFVSQNNATKWKLGCLFGCCQKGTDPNDGKDEFHSIVNSSIHNSSIINNSTYFDIGPIARTETQLELQPASIQHAPVMELTSGTDRTTLRTNQIVTPQIDLTPRTESTPRTDYRLLSPRKNPLVPRLQTRNESIGISKLKVPSNGTLSTLESHRITDTIIRGNITLAFSPSFNRSLNQSISSLSQTIITPITEPNIASTKRSSHQNTESADSSKLLNFSSIHSIDSILMASEPSSKQAKSTPGSDSTPCGFSFGNIKIRTFGLDPNISMMVNYCIENIPLGEGQTGTVFKAHICSKNDTRSAIKNDTRLAIKITPAPGNLRSDAYNEFYFSQQLAKRQKDYVSKELNNIVHIHACSVRKKNAIELKERGVSRKKPWVEYIIVMDKYPGSLNTLLQQQVIHNMDLSLSTFSPPTEVKAMRLTIDLLQQCIAGLKQLQTLHPQLYYNDWSPDNIMVTSTNLPIDVDIVYKLADFGKVRVNEHKFGSALYVSDITDPDYDETQDMNSLAVIGIQMLSVFGSVENVIWEALLDSSLENVVNRIKIPQERDKLITQLLEEVNSDKGEPFKCAEVCDFFKRLGFMVTSTLANVDDFETLLNESLWLLDSLDDDCIFVDHQD